MESSTLEKLQSDTKNLSSIQNKNELYGPPIIPETKTQLYTRKMKREFIYCKVNNKVFSFKFIFDSPVEL
jgi:hypothetical protein